MSNKKNQGSPVGIDEIHENENRTEYKNEWREFIRELQPILLKKNDKKDFFSSALREIMETPTYKRLNLVELTKMNQYFLGEEVLTKSKIIMIKRQFANIIKKSFRFIEKKQPIKTMSLDRKQKTRKLSFGGVGPTTRSVAAAVERASSYELRTTLKPRTRTTRGRKQATGRSRHSCCSLQSLHGEPPRAGITSLSVQQPPQMDVGCMQEYFMESIKLLREINQSNTRIAENIERGRMSQDNQCIDATRFMFFVVLANIFIIGFTLYHMTLSHDYFSENFLRESYANFTTYYEDNRIPANWMLFKPATVFLLFNIVVYYFGSIVRTGISGVSGSRRRVYDLGMVCYFILFSILCYVMSNTQLDNLTSDLERYLESGGTMEDDYKGLFHWFTK